MGVGGGCFHLLSPLILIILFLGYHPLIHEKIKASGLTQLICPTSHNLLSGTARDTRLT